MKKFCCQSRASLISQYSNIKRKPGKLGYENKLNKVVLSSIELLFKRRSISSLINMSENMGFYVFYCWGYKAFYI